MVLDVIIALIIAYAFYSGYSRGVIGTIFSIFSIFIGILAAMKLSPIVIDLLNGMLNINPAIVFIIGFVLTFVGVIVLIRFIGKKLEDLLEFAHLNFINKILGGVLLALVFALIASYGVWFLKKTQILADEQLRSSMTYPLLEPLPEASKGLTKTVRPLFTDFWDIVVETMDTIREKGENLDSDSNDKVIKEG